MKFGTIKQVKLGIFILLGIFFLIVGIYYVGNQKSMFRKTFRISGIFKNVSGLQKGSLVRYSGINVGTVDNIAIRGDSVRVYFRIEENVRKFIKLDAVAVIGSDGLVGAKIIDISSGSKNALAVEGDEIIATGESAGLIPSDALNEIITGINRGQGTVGALLKDSMIAVNFKVTMANIRAGSDEFKSVMSSARQTILADIEKSTKNANQVTAELKELIAAINNGEGALGMMAKDSATKARLEHTLANLEKSSNEMQKFLYVLNNNQGALNHLLNDTATANNLAFTIQNVNNGSKEFTEVMKAMQKSIFLRAYFKEKDREKVQAQKQKKNSNSIQAEKDSIPAVQLAEQP